jgi:adenine deaminase
MGDSAGPALRRRLKGTPMYDLLFRNACIADGLGNPLIEGDLAVTNGRVAAIGRIRDGAAETVDARGLVLAPAATPCSPTCRRSRPCRSTPCKPA